MMSDISSNPFTSDGTSAGMGPVSLNLMLNSGNEENGENLSDKEDETGSNSTIDPSSQTQQFQPTSSSSFLPGSAPRMSHSDQQLPLSSSPPSMGRENSSGSSIFKLASCGAKAPNISSLDVTDVQAKLDYLKSWGVSTYKCTKQALYEHLGKTSRTVDLEVEQKVDHVRDLHKRYSYLLQQAKAFSAHLANMTATQQNISMCLFELGQKELDLQSQLHSSAETQKIVANNAENLLQAVNFFASNLQTLVEKTIEDTLSTIRNYENARLQYDAYRSDLATLQQSQPSVGGEADFRAKLALSERTCEEHKAVFDRLRDDVQVKIKLLDVHRTKVMGNQLLLYQNAVSSYFSGNHAALESTLKQFSIRPNHHNNKPTFLEQ